MNPKNDPPQAGAVCLKRILIHIRGAVQGVGFRPFVYHAARDLGVRGWVANFPEGVLIDAEGDLTGLEAFLERLEAGKPLHASVYGTEIVWQDPAGYENFEIRESLTTGLSRAVLLPDIATCPACLAEIFNPCERRYRYPFTNCTHCGPRFSIIEALPYDRSNTSMRSFELCDACHHEFSDPGDRRFHAQPVACPECGPQLSFRDVSGRILAEKEEALRHAVSLLRDGGILALKGIGGFQLLADATSPKALLRLRALKQRKRKPFAVMVRTAEEAARYCLVAPPEERVLASAEAPIVLLDKRKDPEGPCLAAEIAPGNPCLGIMLAYSPLHHLLLHDLGLPVVATSGNLAEEVILTDEKDALRVFSEKVDGFLTHDRKIVRHADDSIVRIMAGRETVLRRARGYLPVPISVRAAKDTVNILAVGGQLKNTVAAVMNGQYYLSQHIGDLENLETFHAFKHVIRDLERITKCRPEKIAVDMHPDYLAGKFAGRTGLPLVHVQHHYAHALSCMAENGVEGPVLAVVWDGTGFGTDGSIWGGEFLRVTQTGFERMAAFRPFLLPGGDRAVREPRRSALSLVHGLGPEEGARAEGFEFLRPLFRQEEFEVLVQLMDRGTGIPLCSSAGRLFDAAAALTGCSPVSDYEGDAALQLEALAGMAAGEPPYDFRIDMTSGVWKIDWSGIILGILRDRKSGLSDAVVALRFHETLVSVITTVAEHSGERKIVLTGGCFQNRLLTESTVQSLEEKGFQVYRHQRIPPNDGGIALGQILAAVREEESHVSGRSRQDY